jgi:CRP-like cAMP-binding protein
MGPGQTFAEAAVFVFGVYPVSATAVEPATELVEVSGPGFLQLLESDPRLARKMMGSLCQRLVSLVQRVEELSIPSAAARLARYVLGCPSQAGAALEVVLPMAKKELAAHLAMTPETLSRQFARWRERGWIEMDGRTVAIRDPASLETLSQG